MKYDFDAIIERSTHFSAKYDELNLKFGREDIVSMWVADMDFPSPQPVIDAIKNRAEHGIFGYTSRPDCYFQAMLDWYKRRYNWDIESKSIIHSPGVVTSLSIIMREFTKPGDKIIVQPPVYYPFFDVIKDNDRHIVCNPLKRVAEEYVMDYEDLEKKLDNQVKYLILCNPHNPVGRVWTKAELIKLGDLCVKKNVKVISDEIHGDLVYNGRNYTPFASISEEFSMNSITCLSATKTFNIAGLQASFAIFPDRADYEKFVKILGILDIKRNSCFNLVAIEAAYRYGEEWLNQVLAYLESNIEFVIDYCHTNIPCIKPNRPEGTYLVWLNCKEVGLNHAQLNDFMIHKAKLALDSGNWFGEEGSGYMRINIACPRTILAKGLKQLEQAVKTLENK